MKVYTVYLVYGDGDGYASISPLGVGATLKTAKKIITNNFEDNYSDTMYLLDSKIMTKENDYTMITNNLSDFESGFVDYGRFGGFVIFITELLFLGK